MYKFLYKTKKTLLIVIVIVAIAAGSYFSLAIARKTQWTVSFFTGLASEKKDKEENIKGYIVVLPQSPLVLSSKITGAQAPVSLSAEREVIQNKIKDILGKQSVNTNAPLSPASEKTKTLEVVTEWEKVLNAFLINITSKEAGKLADLSDIEGIYPNNKVVVTLNESVPLIGADKVWPLDKNQKTCPKNGESCLTGRGVKIGILDTGVDYTHADLGGCFGAACKVVGGYDFVDNDADPMDEHGHGTHVAATAAGKGTLDGVAPNAKVVAYRVLDSSGSGYADDIISAVERSIDPDQDGNFSDHLDIISLSLGGFGNPDDAMSKAIDNAVESGVVATVAAGNWGPSADSISSPGTSRRAITVGATDKKDILPDFSGRGPITWKDKKGGQRFLHKPDITAPGVEICAAEFGTWKSDKRCKDDKHISISGTSMATPHVAGIVALIKQAHSDWTPDEIKMAIRNNTKVIKDDLDNYGYGRVDAFKEVFSKKPAVAKITTNGTVFGSDFEVTGTAWADDLTSYKISYRENEPLGVWATLCTRSKAVKEGLLCNGKLNDGKYDLRLTVTSGTISTSTDYSRIEIKNQAITYPLDLNDTAEKREILPGWKTISVTGLAGGEDFDHYEIKWCPSSGAISEQGAGSNCSNKGVVLTGGGKKTVKDGKLAAFDPSAVSKTGTYNLELKTVSKKGDETVTSIKIYIDKELKKGWPTSLDVLETGSPKGVKGLFSYTNRQDSKLTAYSSKFQTTAKTAGFALSFQRQPTLADINGDGKKETITAYSDLIQVFDSEGKSLSGWPKKIGSGCDVQQGPAVDNIDSSSTSEIVIGDNCGQLHVLDYQGKYLPGFPKGSFGYTVAPTISDLEEDGEKEIILGNWDSKIYVLSPNGSAKKGWPQTLKYQNQNASFLNMIYESLAAGDLDGDGKKEIVAIGHQCFNSDHPSYCSYSDRKDRLYVYKSDGALLWEPIEFTSAVRSAPVLADLNGDGFLDIIVTTRKGELYALDYKGKDVAGFPVKYANSEFISGLAVGDLDHDSQPEIVSVLYNLKPYNICLYVFRGDGSVRKGWPICSQDTGFYYQYWGSNISLANLDTDSDNEIISSFDKYDYNTKMYNLYAYDPDGAIVKGFPKMVDDLSLGDTFPVGDIDNDGQNELFAYSWSGNLFAWGLPSSQDEWSFYQRDARHTGSLNNVKAAPATGELRGKVLKDTNGNGKFDDSEKYIRDPLGPSCIKDEIVESGVIISYDGPKKGTVKLDKCSTTSFNPIYSINLPVGTYKVSVSPPKDWAVEEGEVTVTVAKGGSLVQIFNLKPSTGTCEKERCSNLYYQCRAVNIRYSPGYPACNAIGAESFVYDASCTKGTVTGKCPEPTKTPEPTCENERCSNIYRYCKAKNIKYSIGYPTCNATGAEYFVYDKDCDCNGRTDCIDGVAAGKCTP